VRRRLLASTLTIALASLVLFGVPLGFVIDRVIHDDAQSRLEREALRVARQPLIQTADRATLIANLRRFVPEDDRAVLRLPDGTIVWTSSRIEDPLSVTVPGPNNSQLHLETPAGPVEDRVQRALLLLVLLGIAGIGAALMLALVQSRRLADPLSRLARSASRLGEGDFSLAPLRSDVPEIDEIGIALDRSAERIERLLRTERSFSANASHQLRSALTGLQLRIEELTSNPDPNVRAEAEAALEQCNRLASTIDELLALARTGRAGIVTPFDLAVLARQHADDVAPVLAREGRRITVQAAQPAPVVAAIGAVGQVLDVLLGNAANHGAGTVTVTVSADDRHARLDVADEGDGIALDQLDALFRAPNDGAGHGLGLALARTLVQTEGGTITLQRARPPVFRVELPRG
jgi:signal transduction histidine kinase